MKNRQVVILFCEIAIGLVAVISANACLTELYSTPNDLPNLPHLAALNAYAETTPGTGLESRIDPDCNDYPDDMIPAIITETRPSRLTILGR